MPKKVDGDLCLLGVCRSNGKSRVHYWFSRGGATGVLVVWQKHYMVSGLVSLKLNLMLVLK